MARARPRLGPRRSMFPRALPPPAGFGWTTAPTIRELSPGRYTCDLDVTTLRPATAATFYVDSTRASNAGTGQSWATAEQAIWAGLNNVGASATKILILGSASASTPTLYGYAKAWRVGTANSLYVSVVSDQNETPGYAVSSTALVAGDGELGAWALTADPNGPNVYQATLTTAPGRVVDAATMTTGGASTLTSRASVALVEANPGSYYHAAGVLYVRTADSRVPDTNLRPLRGGTTINGLVNTASTIYIERLSFEGGSSRVFYVQNGATVVLVDCDIDRGTLGGLELNSLVGTTNATIYVYAIRCRFRGNAGDGCGYTANGSGMTVRAFEWDCTYQANSGVGTDQGGSGHFTTGNAAIQIIRLNPTCLGNKTQGFADVGGCQVWMVGGSVTGEVTGIYAGDSTTTYVQGTTLAGNTTDLQTDNAAGRIYVSDLSAGSLTTTGAGVVTGYVP